MNKPAELSAATIRKLRRHLGMTQDEFAIHFETTQPVVSKIEKGRNSPSGALAIRLHDAIVKMTDNRLLIAEVKASPLSAAGPANSGMPGAAATEPGAVSGDRNDAGDLVLTVQRGSPIFTIAHKLLRLAAAASAEERAAVLRRLENPTLYAGTTMPTQPGFVAGLRRGLARAGVNPDSAEGARIIADALADLEAGISPQQQLAKAQAGRKVENLGTATPREASPRSGTGRKS